MDVVAPGASPLMNVMDMGSGSVNPAPAAPGSILLPAEKGAGLEIAGVVARGGAGAPVYNLTFTNRTQAPLDGFQLQFNKNTFGLTPASQPQMDPVQPGDSRSCQLALTFSGNSSGGVASATLQVAVKSPRQNPAVFYFNDQVPLEAVLVAEGRMDAAVFAQQWQSIPAAQEHTQQLPVSPAMANPDAAARALGAANLFFVSTRAVPGTNLTAACFSGKAPGPQAESWLLLEITFAPGVHAVKMAVRERAPAGLAALALTAVQRVLSRAQ